MNRWSVPFNMIKMGELREYRIVRFIKLFRPSNEYNDWSVNQGKPQIGETGTLIDLLCAPNLPDMYVVENAGNDGIPIWMSEFMAEEIEPIMPSGDSVVKLMT
jgi:hypothetical protein